jgi:hypothetical protein
LILSLIVHLIMLVFHLCDYNCGVVAHKCFVFVSLDG